MRQSWITNRRTQVGEQTEMLAQRQQRPALWLFIWRQMFPLRPANRSKQNRARIFTGFHGRRRQCFASPINRCSAHQLMVIGQADSVLCGCGIEHFERRLHDFWTNAVTGENCYFVLFGHGFS